MANNWTDKLPADVCGRLAACRSLRSDLPILVNVKWASMVEAGKKAEGFTKEDALVQILDLLDCNGQYRLADLTWAECDALASE